MSLIVDGKKYSKPQSIQFKRMKGFLDKLPYKQLVTSRNLNIKIGYSEKTNPLSNLLPDEIAYMERHRFRLEYHKVVWGNSKTIRDLKNGKLTP